MITKAEIEKVASLAKLKYSDEELEQFVPKFEETINFFDELNKVDTEGVTPTYHSSKLLNIFRDDIAIPSTEEERAALLKNAPTTKDGLIQVPSIIEE